MIMELAGVRIISPFFGSSHIVYTSIIGIIMAALSIGYWFGGKLSAKNPSNKKLSLIIFSAGLYILFLGLFQFNFLVYLNNFNLSLIINSILSSLIMFAIPSILLGIVSPYTIQLAINEQKIKENTGSLVGRFYAFSTIGSILGTFLCGFYLIIKFGINHIFIFLSLIIFLCSFLYLLIDLKNKKKTKNIKSIVIQLLAIFTTFSLLFYFSNNPIAVKVYEKAKIIHSSTSTYNFINIIEIKFDNNDFLLLENGYSMMELNKNPNEVAYDYTKLFHNIFINKEKRNNILILGNAVGTFVSGALYHIEQKNLQNINFDIVEIDPALTDVGEKYFGFPKNNKLLTYFYEDARTFLNRETNKKYDLIYYDIYNNSLIFPFHLITKETFEKINNLLENDGIFIMNIVGDTEKESKKYAYLRQIYTQVKKMFPQVSVYKMKNEEYNQDLPKNYLICGYKSNKDNNIKSIKEMLSNLELKDIEESNEIFTDEFSPVEKFF